MPMVIKVKANPGHLVSYYVVIVAKEKAIV